MTAGTLFNFFFVQTSHDKELSSVLAEGRLSMFKLNTSLKRNRLIEEPKQCSIYK